MVSTERTVSIPVVMRSTITNSSVGEGYDDQHLQHEPVDLRLGQWIGALGLDRVLRGHHEEGVRHRVGLPPDGHLSLLHDLEQRALHLRRRAVDLVGEQEVREHRPERRRELARALVVDAGADEVGGHEVGRELDALELPADGIGERLDRQRLGETGHALDEHVAAGEERDGQPFEQLVLPDDDLLHLVEHLLHRLTVVGMAVPWVLPSRVGSSVSSAGCGRRRRRPPPIGTAKPMPTKKR